MDIQVDKVMQMQCEFWSRKLDFVILNWLYQSKLPTVFSKIILDLHLETIFVTYKSYLKSRPFECKTILLCIFLWQPFKQAFLDWIVNTNFIPLIVNFISVLSCLKHRSLKEGDTASATYINSWPYANKC